jgi:hypothetical protein
MKVDRHLYDSVMERARNEDGQSPGPLFVYASHDSSIVGSDENAFISEALDPDENETVLMSAGDPEASERFFYSVKSGLDNLQEAGRR